MIDLDKLLTYIDAKIAYELANAINSHEHHYHDGDGSACLTERKAMESALRELHSSPRGVRPNPPD